jgi:hypothetical protein
MILNGFMLHMLKIFQSVDQERLREKVLQVNKELKIENLKASNGLLD